MQGVIALAIVFLGLFLASFIMKRKFGVLGLALGAGSTLAVVWSKEISYVISMIGIRESTFSNSLISIIVTLLPAIVLLIHGASYKGKMLRILGSLMFAALGLTLILPSLSSLVEISGFGTNIYNILTSERDFIVGIGLILAVVDLFFTKAGPNHPEKHHKH